MSEPTKLVVTVPTFKFGTTWHPAQFLSQDFFLKALSYLRYPITKYIKIVYVKEQKFKKNIVNMINEVRKYNSNCLFLNIGIMKSSKNNKKSYGYNQNIDDYNNILKSIFKENYIFHINSNLKMKKNILL